MKRRLWLFLPLWLLPLTAWGEALGQARGDTLDSLALTPWQQAWQALFPEGADVREVLLQLARGELSLDGTALLQGLGSYFIGAVKNSLWRLSALIVPAVFFGMLQRMRSAFARPALGEALSAGCFLVLSGVLARDDVLKMVSGSKSVDFKELGENF